MKNELSINNYNLLSSKQENENEICYHKFISLIGIRSIYEEFIINKKTNNRKHHIFYHEGFQLPENEGIMIITKYERKK